MNVSDAWRLGHPWSYAYSFGITRPAIAGPVASLAFGTDIDLLYAAADDLDVLAPGSVVLDVPCGSGVAVRRLTPGRGLRYVAADISTAMLGRTRAVARARGVADQVETLAADVAHLPVPDATVDLVLSLTGLHCFPDPRAAVLELGRVARPGGRLSLSWLRTDGGLRYRPILTAGRVSGVVGPSASVPQVEDWLDAAGFADTDLRTSGALAYVRARRR